MRLDDAGLDVIERRATAVRAVRQVVHAIWAVARAQLPLAQAAAADATAYLDEVDRVLRRFTEPGPGAREGASLLVLVGPERPYCGALPARLLEQLPETGTVGIVGRRLSEVARRDAQLSRRIRFELPGPSTHDEAAHVARDLARAVLAVAGTGAVELHHPRAGGSALHRVVLLQERPQIRGMTPPTYAPVDEVVARIVRESIEGRLAVAVAESLWSEVQARVVTAESARHACDDQLDDLTMAWRVARQEQITTELLEVVASRFGVRARPAV